MLNRTMSVIKFLAYIGLALVVLLVPALYLGRRVYST